MDYDISFLKPFLKSNGISQKSIADKMNVSLTKLNDYLNGRKINDSKMILLLEIFNVKSYEELKEMVENSTYYEHNYDISFLKEYFKEKSISQTEFADKLGITRSIISNYLNGYILATEKNMVKILNFFKVSSYEELKEMVEKEKKKSDIKSREKLEEKKSLNFNRANIYTEDSSFYNHNYKDSVLKKAGIDLNKLIKYLNSYDVSVDTYKVVTMIFNDIKDYNISEISDATNFTIPEILNIYETCLQIYNRELKKRLM